MTRKLTSILLSVLILCSLIGCNSNTAQLQQPVAFFYPEKVQDDGSVTNVINCENREGAQFGGDLHKMLTTYLAGPKDPALYSPFPAYTELIEVSLSEGKVILLFDEAFGSLSSLERTIACACISQTCMAFTGAQQVEIFAENTLFDGMESILITEKNLLTQDNSPIAAP